MCLPPKLDSGGIIIRVGVCAVCATDIRIYCHGHPNVRLPHILGHEIAGEIVSVSKGIVDYHMGQRVAVAPTIVSIR